MSRHNEKQLQSFLEKVDDIGSIIKNMNEGDEKTKQDALQKADNYLKRNKKETNSGFSKTMINKIQDDDDVQPEQRDEMSAEEFMKGVEDDAAKRNRKKKEQKEKAIFWKGKGNAYFKEEKYSDAVESYSEAIRLCPDEIIFYSNRAQGLIKLEKYEAALADCETGLKLNKSFVKIYVHQGRALTGLKRYQEATASFNKVAKIDKKQQKLVNEYINGVEREKQLNIEEEKASLLLQEGDPDLLEIKELVSKLRKGSPPGIWQGNDIIVKLRKLVAKTNHRTIFRNAKGFNIFDDHPALSKLLRKTSFSPEEIKVVANIIGLLTNAITGSEENCNIMCSMHYLLDAAMQCLKIGKGLSEKFEAVQLFHQVSQYCSPRKHLFTSSFMPELLSEALAIIAKGGDLALVAMGTINNLALDSSFVEQFKERLSSDFIPGVIKMMELLALTFPDISLTKTFLPVMASSISTIANLFHNAELRKQQAQQDQTIWKTSHQLLTKYSNQLDDKSIVKVVHAILGMLMNLSTHKVTFEEEFAKKWINLSGVLICSSYPIIVERISGILNHTLGNNNAMLKEIIDRNVYLDFLKILKGDNKDAKRFIVKCVAHCVNIDEGVRNSIYSCKTIPCLLECLDSKDELVIGNTALIFADCHGVIAIVMELVELGFIKKLLTHATNDNLSKTVRHNCAIAIGKFCLADPRYLQQLRDLHGMEILHEVMKESKLV